MSIEVRECSYPWDQCISSVVLKRFAACQRLVCNTVERLPNLIWPLDVYHLLLFCIGAYNSAGEETWMDSIKTDYIALEVVVKGTRGQLVFSVLWVRPEVSKRETDWSSMSTVVYASGFSIRVLGFCCCGNVFEHQWLLGIDKILLGGIKTPLPVDWPPWLGELQTRNINGGRGWQAIHKGISWLGWQTSSVR